MTKIINYVDFWHKWYGEEFSDTFERIFSNMKLNKPITLYSKFGNTPLTKDTINVCFSGENYDRTDEAFDLHLIMKKTDLDKNIVCYPYFTYYPCKHDFWKILQAPRKPYSIKDRFCIFVVSNPATPDHIRNRFMAILSHVYKKVDSCGLAYNNTGFRAPGFQGEYNPEYYALIGRYKFMICFENNVGEYYCTEKLYNAYMGGAVPIYWGCPKVKEWFNTKSFLYLEDTSDESILQLIAKIVEIDNDDAKYNEIYNQPLLKDGKIPEEMDIEVIRKHAEEVLRRKGFIDQ